MPNVSTRFYVPATRFIGREQEMAEVRRLLLASRILTLTGAGGVGKTRLALETTASLADGYRDGVWFVQLASLSVPDLVPQEVASSLGLPEQHGRPLLGTLSDYLRTKQALLILDNCEHLVAACALLAEALVQTCPQLQILATSRETLGIAGEVGWRVPSLSLPGPCESLPAERLIEYEAIRLFVERAQAALPSFSLTAQNAPVVADICQRLDGIPLAIELTAARVKVLSPEQIASRLNDLFGLLTTGSRTALPRHQTLRALVDWSYHLLSDPERRLFNRLSIFAGGWGLAAAEAVCAGGEVPKAQVLEVLALLVDKSLVVAEPRGREMRYRLLEPMRQYAAERLRESGEDVLLCNRHLDWFVHYAEAVEPELRGPSLRTALDRLEAEHDNLRAALDWSTREGGDATAALRLSGALGWFWWMRGYLREGRRWLTSALACGSERPATRLKALAAASWITNYQLDVAASRGYAEECRAIAQATGDRWAEAWALHLLGRNHYLEGDYQAARARGNESLAVAREVGDRWLIGWAIHLLGLAAHVEGNYRAARALYEESLAIRREIGHEEGVASLLILLGITAFRLGEHARGRAESVQSLMLMQKLAFRASINGALVNLCALAAAHHQPERAIRLGSAALAQSENVGRLLIPLSQSVLMEALEGARGAVSEQVYAQAWSDGEALSLEQALAEALRVEFPPEAAADQSPAGLTSVAAAGPPGQPPLLLTPREIEVLRLIVAGSTSKEIAAELVISVATVDRHITHIYTKIGARRRADATAFAIARGLVRPTANP